MALEIINIGTSPNDGQGDALRSAFEKCNNNFVQLFSTAGITGLANGTSSVNIPTANGNINLSASGTSNVVVITQNGANVFGKLDVSGMTTLSNLNVVGSFVGNGTIQSLADVTAVNLNASANIVGQNLIAVGQTTSGTLSLIGNVVSALNVTPNLAAGNISTPGIVSAAGNIVTARYFIGDGGFLSNVTVASNVAVTQIANGTTTMAVTGSGSNIAATIGGVANIFVLTSSGANVTGTFNTTGAVAFGSTLSTTGNITGGNISTAGRITSTGNIDTAGGISALGNISANNISTLGSLTAASYDATGNITGGNLVTLGRVSANTVTVTSTASVNGTITGGNILTTGLISAAGQVTAVGNIQGQNILTPNNVIASGNVSGANIVAGTSISSAGNITGANVNSGSITATGTITGGNLTTAGVVSTSGGILVSSGAIVASASNQRVEIGAPGSVNSPYIDFRSSGNASLDYDVRIIASGGNNGNDGTGTLTINASTVSATGGVTAASTITGGNLLTSGRVSAAGNITAGGTASISGSVTGGNLFSNGLISATGTITASGNIAASGNISTSSQFVAVGNITTSANVSANYYIGNGALLTGVNATQVGVLPSLSVTGNIVGGNVQSLGILRVNSTNQATAIVNDGSNAVGNIGSSTSYFNRVFAQATTALYADLAELYAGDAEYEPGTVLSFGGANEVTMSSFAGDTRIAGIVSTNPSYEMNSGLIAEYPVKLALQGRVPTKVVGPIRKGDMMVSAGNGFAQACATPSFGSVLGKSLEDFNGEHGVIEIVVGRM